MDGQTKISIICSKLQTRKPVICRKTSTVDARMSLTWTRFSDLLYKFNKGIIMKRRKPCRCY